MTALERIARALAAQHWRDTGASEEDVLAFADIDWREFVPDARAALTALREPDEAMDFAGLTALVERRPIAADTDDIHAVWRAMIDAALQEGQ